LHCFLICPNATFIKLYKRVTQHAKKKKKKKNTLAFEYLVLTKEPKNAIDAVAVTPRFGDQVYK
jgi:hypothetical protein